MSVGACRFTRLRQDDYRDVRAKYASNTATAHPSKPTAFINPFEVLELALPRRSSLAKSGRKAQINPLISHKIAPASKKTFVSSVTNRSARDQLGRVADNLEPRFPRVAALLYEAQEDVLAFMAFPTEHHRPIRSTNPLERLNKEAKRRADVVGIFPNRQTVIRLMGAILAEQDDEWVTGRRYFSQESMAKLRQASATASELALLAAD